MSYEISRLLNLEGGRMIKNKKNIYGNNGNSLLRLLVLSVLIVWIIGTTVSSVGAVPDLYDTLNASVDIYNNNLDKVPSIVKYMLGNEITYVTIAMNNGDNLELKMVMKDAKVVQFEKIIGFDESATVRVATNEKMVGELLTSGNHIDTFMTAMDDGTIKIEGTGIVMYAIIKSLSILMGISKLIGSLVGIIKSIF